MSSAAITLPGPVSTLPGKAPDADARSPEKADEAIAPTLSGQEPSRYQPRAWPARPVALGAAAVIHLSALVIAILEWRQPEPLPQRPDTVVVTVLPPVPDRPADKPIRGQPANTITPEPVALQPPLPIAEPVLQEAVVEAKPLQEPDTLDSGTDDRLEQATHAYQQAVLARIQEQRRYPRAALLAGFQGQGAILFTIDREGRLLDSSISDSTGRKALDRATLSLVRRAAPFPAIPADLPDELAVTMPIRFLIVQSENSVAAR